jgi:hypothetical protein
VVQWRIGCFPKVGLPRQSHVTKADAAEAGPANRSEAVSVVESHGPAYRLLDSLVSIGAIYTRSLSRSWSL